MTYTDIIAHFGSPTKTADGLGYSIATLYQWRRQGIPIRAQEVIQARTNGELKMDEQATQERERYEMLSEAFKELAGLCVSKESMDTLLSETGFSAKHLQQIIKESGKVC